MRLIVFALVFLTCSNPVIAGTSALTSQDRDAVISEVVTHLKDDYVDPIIGQQAARQLLDDVASDRFTAYRLGEAFADALSTRLQELTGDGHLNVEFSVDPIDLSAPAEETFGAEEIEKYYGAHLNFGLQTAGRLEGNIGYVDLRVFAPISLGADTVASAMNVIANTDALIIDLRENGGGMGDMADFVASYLFDGGRHPLTGIYDRPTDTLTQRFTQAYVPGKRFGGDKPVYVLVSRRTFSAAEALAYNLQALHRATIVGEVSGGGAHPFEYLPIHPHFVLWSVTAKSVNPITGTNWQGVGVAPDISVAAEDALEIAVQEIKRRE